MLGKSLGLDLGSHTVKVVELNQTLRGVEVTRVHAVPRVEGQTEGALLQQLFREHKLPADRVVAAVAGDKLSRRQVHFPFRERRRIAQAVPFEVESALPFELDDYIVDWELVGQRDGGSEVAAAVAPRAEVERIVQGLREAGAEPRVLEAEGLVLGNLCEWMPLEGVRLLIDLGHTKTTLCLLIEGRPRAARTLPLGGEAVTLAIARARGCGPDQAERLKHDEGIFSRGFESEVPGASAALDRLARELVRSLGSFEAVLQGPAKATLDEITLLGGGARLRRIDEFLAERTGVRTARLQVPPGEASSAFVAAGDPLRFAPALALALRGTLKARTRTNLLQGEFAPRLDLRSAGRQLRWTGVLAAAAVLLGIASAVTSVTLDSRHARGLEAQVAQLWEEAAPGRPVPADVSLALAENLRATRQRAQMLGIYGGNLSALDVLTEISARIPDGLAVVFEEVTIDGQVVRLRGHTESFGAVDQLRTALASFPHFNDIRVSEIQDDEKLGVKNFSITISLGEKETS